MSKEEIRQNEHYIPVEKLTRTDSFIQNKLLPSLKAVGNIIIVALIFALLLTIVFKLYVLFFVDLINGDFQSVINNLLLTLILIELFTILYSYLLKHYIKVERVIELGIISLVREMLFKVEQFESSKIYAVSVLLVAFGVIFFIEKYWSKTRNQ